MKRWRLGDDQPQGPQLLRTQLGCGHRLSGPRANRGHPEGDIRAQVCRAGPCAACTPTMRTMLRKSQLWLCIQSDCVQHRPSEPASQPSASQPSLWSSLSPQLSTSPPALGQAWAALGKLLAPPCPPQPARLTARAPVVPGRPCLTSFASQLPTSDPWGLWAPPPQTHTSLGPPDTNALPTKALRTPRNPNRFLGLSPLGNRTPRKLCDPLPAPHHSGPSTERCSASHLDMNG